jgi:hypothetical protein
VGESRRDGDGEEREERELSGRVKARHTTFAVNDSVSRIFCGATNG